MQKCESLRSRCIANPRWRGACPISNELAGVRDDDDGKSHPRRKLPILVIDRAVDEPVRIIIDIYTWVQIPLEGIRAGKAFH
jgi:hypothetical protein